MEDEPTTEVEEQHLFIKDQDSTTRVIFVRPTTPVHPLAACIRALMDDGFHVVTRGMGAGPTTQAVKAWAIVRQRFSREGSDLLVAPFFQTVSWHGIPSTALCMQGIVQGS
jgi:stage V sporulation protein SpoVS